MTQSVTQINLTALVAAFSRVVDDYKRLGVHDIDISGKDAYWVVATDESFDLERDPGGTLGVGSLGDDLEELAKLMSDDTRPSSAVDVERLGNLLRATAQALSE